MYKCCQVPLLWSDSLLHTYRIYQCVQFVSISTLWQIQQIVASIITFIIDGIYLQYMGEGSGREGGERENSYFGSSDTG